MCYRCNYKKNENVMEKQHNLELRLRNYLQLTHIPVVTSHGGKGAGSGYDECDSIPDTMCFVEARIDPTKPRNSAIKYTALRVIAHRLHLPLTCGSESEHFGAKSSQLLRAPL